MEDTFTWENIRGGVLYEDEAVLVLNKPAGISVVGDRNNPDVLTLASEAGERFIPAHRIDKETSGAILLAKEPRIQAELTRQFAKHTVEKAYLAIVAGTGLPEQGKIDLPLSVGRKNRVRIAAMRENIRFDTGANTWSVLPKDILPHTKNYPSVTPFTKIWEDKDYTLLIVLPTTGRRHQIRVHLAWIGYPIVGDPLFDKERTSRMLLHAWRLAFEESWKENKTISVEAKPRDDFWQLVGDQTGILKQM